MTGTSHFELVDPIFFEFLAKHGLTYIGWDFSSVDLRYACVGLAQNGSPLYIVSIHRVENGKATVALLDSEKSTEIMKETVDLPQLLPTLDSYYYLAKAEIAKLENYYNYDSLAEKFLLWNRRRGVISRSCNESNWEFLFNHESYHTEPLRIRFRFEREKYSVSVLSLDKSIVYAETKFEPLSIDDGLPGSTWIGFDIQEAISRYCRHNATKNSELSSGWYALKDPNYPTNAVFDQFVDSHSLDSFTNRMWNHLKIAKIGLSALGEDLFHIQFDLPNLDNETIQVKFVELGRGVIEDKVYSYEDLPAALENYYQLARQKIGQIENYYDYKGLVTKWLALRSTYIRREKGNDFRFLYRKSVHEDYSRQIDVFPKKEGAPEYHLIVRDLTGGHVLGEVRTKLLELDGALSWAANIAYSEPSPSSDEKRSNVLSFLDRFKK